MKGQKEGCGSEGRWGKFIVDQDLHVMEPGYSEAISESLKIFELKSDMINWSLKKEQKQKNVPK